MEIEDAWTFTKLKWDTEFFDVTSAKATLHKPLKREEWKELKLKLKEYQFISIINKNSEPTNAQLIGKETSAFLTDVNIQFEKKLNDSNEPPKNVTIHQALERNDQIIEIAEFQYSKFTEDPELAKRGGVNVYQQWLINSFAKPDKFYALTKNEIGDINGFLLFSYIEDVCLVELIAVSQNATKGGIGGSLFNAVEYEAHQRGVKKIKVGTQIRNCGAINFYQKVGCKQVECHQIFHLWNLSTLD